MMKTLTLSQLINELNSLVRNDPKNRHLPVILEGCDCTGDCSGVKIWSDSVLLCRTDGDFNVGVPIEEVTLTDI